MHLDLTDEETLALLNLLIETIEADRYPMSPRIRLLQAILGKCGEVGGPQPDLDSSGSFRRYAPPPPARRWARLAVAEAGQRDDSGLGIAGKSGE